MFEGDKPIATVQTTPNELSKLSKEFKEQIYDVFKYGTINNHVRTAKKHFSREVGLLLQFLILHHLLTMFLFWLLTDDPDRNDIDLLADSDDDNSSVNSVAIVPKVLAKPPPAASKPWTPKKTNTASVETPPLENEIKDEKLLVTDTCPCVSTFQDSERVHHIQVRWTPPHGVLRFHEETLRNVVFPKIIDEGYGLELKFRYPQSLYALEASTDLDCWDHIYGCSSFLAKTAMVQKELDLRDAYEQQGFIWAVQRVNFEKKVEIIESFQFEGEGDKKCVLIALVGPNSDYKKRKLNEDAIYT